MKEVSVIMPVYNEEKNLEKTILSVVNQTFKNSYELIIVNDGSKDKSKQIIEKYQKKYPNLIRFIDKENTGVSDSRNVALDIANSKYVTFIDADDIYESDYLEKMYSHIQLGHDIVSCNYKNFEFNNGKIGYDNKFETIDISYYLENLQSNYLFNQLWNKIYKLSIINENNIKFDINKSIAEDWEFNVIYLSFCHSMMHINEYLYMYRVTNSGLGFKYRKDSNYIKFNILDKTYNLFVDNKLNTQYLQKCYIIQIFSYFSVIMDSRNKEPFFEKKSKINKFILSKKYSDILNKICIKKIKYRFVLNVLKIKNSFLFCIFGVIANKYDKYKKKKHFGV